MGFPLLFLCCVLHNWMLYVFQKAAKVTVTAIIHCATEQQHHLERYYITQLCIPPITASACCAAFRLACVVITLVKNNGGAKCVRPLSVSQVWASGRFHCEQCSTLIQKSF